jgi:hypothetical protein
LPNLPETRANAGAPHFDGKNDGKFLRGSLRAITNQQLGRLVDDRVGVGATGVAVTTRFINGLQACVTM